MSNTSPIIALIKKLAPATAVAAGLFAAQIWIETINERRGRINPPEGEVYLSDFLDSGRKTHEVRQFVYDQRNHTAVFGVARMFLTSLPSGPPVYVFDEHGLLIDWSRDIGDNPKFVEKWGAFSNSVPPAK